MPDIPNNRVYGQIEKMAFGANKKINTDFFSKKLGTGRQNWPGNML